MDLQPKFRAIPQNVQQQVPLTPEENARRWKQQQFLPKVEKYRKQHEALHNYFEGVIKTTLPSYYGTMVPEFQFSQYRYRFDYCWPQFKVAVDIQGGIYHNRKKGRQSGHVSIKGMENDMMKINLAQSLGWVMLQLSPRKIKQQPYYVAETIVKCVQLQIQRGVK